ncbi:uncharacterized protein M6B38_362915 [Iris pallida]|uniref:Uncharacterized protein n=1 Tax=Iris pallida TaxID=29817 RepID=A0AAX6GII3_IRIPA|nr:uncharacterized protein M6B38_362915 [Iris pallida]
MGPMPQPDRRPSRPDDDVHLPPELLPQGQAEAGAPQVPRSRLRRRRHRSPPPPPCSSSSPGTLRGGRRPSPTARSRGSASTRRPGLSSPGGAPAVSEFFLIVSDPVDDSMRVELCRKRGAPVRRRRGFGRAANYMASWDELGLDGLALAEGTSPCTCRTAPYRRRGRGSWW